MHEGGARTASGERAPRATIPETRLRRLQLQRELVQGVGIVRVEILSLRRMVAVVEGFVDRVGPGARRGRETDCQC